MRSVEKDLGRMSSLFKKNKFMENERNNFISLEFISLENIALISRCYHTKNTQKMR